MSDSADIFCRGILHCCFNLGYRKSLEKRGEGVSRFSVKNVLLRVPKISVGKSFTVASFSSSEKVWIGWGEYRDFPSKNFFLTERKSFEEESFTVALILGIEKVWIRVGVINIFCRSFSVSQCRKFP